MARYRDTSIARYTQPDPLGLYDGPNPYIFAQNNPINNSDPTGLYTAYGIPDIGNTNQYNGGVPYPNDPCDCFVKTLGLDTLLGAGLVAGGQPTMGKRFFKMAPQKVPPQFQKVFQKLSRRGYLSKCLLRPQRDLSLLQIKLDAYWVDGRR